MTGAQIVELLHGALKFNRRKLGIPTAFDSEIRDGVLVLLDGKREWFVRLDFGGKPGKPCPCCGGEIVTQRVCDKCKAIIPEGT